MEVREGYKQTEVGVIPSDWEVKKLGEVADIVSGGTPSTNRKEFWDGDIFWCTPTDITALCGSKYLIDTARKISPLGLKNCSAEVLPKNSIVMTTRATIGECAINKIPVSTNQGFKSFIPKEEINAEFLYYKLLTQKPKFVQLGSGSTFFEVSKKDIKDFQITLPPTKAEQTAIATALSDADALISRLENLIAKKRNIKQGAMQELLIGKKRLPGFSGEWEVKRIGEYLKFQVGYPFSSIYFNQKNEGIRLVKNRDLKSDDQVFYFNGDYPNEYLVSDGDVLIGMDGDFLPCLWKKGKAVLNQRVGRLVVKRDFDLRFAYYLLAKPLKEIENSTSSTTVKHLSHKDVEKIEIAIPSKAEQTRIATILSDMDAEIEQLEQKLDKFKMIKQGMMQELLTGKTRLI